LRNCFTPYKHFKPGSLRLVSQFISEFPDEGSEEVDVYILAQLKLIKNLFKKITR
jgi:hypothetical protein